MLLALISDFSKVAEYKVNVQKTIVFLHTNSEYMDTEIKNITRFTTAQENT